MSTVDNTRISSLVKQNRKLESSSLPQLFGEILRRSRLSARFSSPEALSRALHYHYGCDHSGRSIYRYESGASTPPLDFLVAASLLLETNLFDTLLYKALSKDDSKQKKSL